MNETPTNTDRIDEGRQQILDAFSSLKIPRSWHLIGPTTGDKSGEKQLRQDLTGKSWQSLEAAFLNDRWSAFCYLSDKGYRYYLPALLMRCLDEFSLSNPLLHSTVFSLQPSYWSLYYEGGDDRFDYQNSLFDSEQYGAVCSFLGLVMDTLPDLSFLSAKALRWGWNRQEHPALEKCRAFYRGFHFYQYPPHGDEKTRQLIEQIKDAFAATPYPGDKALCGSEQGDEPAEYALEFAGLDWRQIHPEFLAVHYAALSFLSHAGFRYFLPAYLIADLYDNDSNADPVFHLTHGLAPERPAPSLKELADSGLEIGSEFLTEMGISPEEVASMLEEEESDPIDWHQYATERLEAFTSAERAAIVDYLRLKADEDEYVAPDIKHALENYWLKTR